MMHSYRLTALHANTSVFNHMAEGGGVELSVEIYVSLSLGLSIIKFFLQQNKLESL